MTVKNSRLTPFPAMQLRIADYNRRKLTVPQRPSYTPVYNDEFSGEDDEQ
jgi:hypothetical protein